MNYEPDRQTRITRRLEEHGVYATVTGTAGIVRLEGAVESPELKRSATDLVFDIDPSVLVVNELDVTPYLSLADETLSWYLTHQPRSHGS